MKVSAVVDLWRQSTMNTSCSVRVRGGGAVWFTGSCWPDMLVALGGMVAVAPGAARARFGAC